MFQWLRLIRPVRVPADPVDTVEFLQKGVNQLISRGYIYNIEIGNEPDHYAKNAYRPATYSYNDFIGEFTTAYDAISEVMGPDMKYQGYTN